MTAIKYGVCGLGRIGMVHCKHFSRAKEQYQQVALCDLDAARVDDMQQQYGGKGYTDYSAFLADADMELVIIATRSLDHVRNAKQALEAGKIVLLEKPIAVTEADYALLVELDKTYPGKLYCGHNHRFEAAFQQIFAIVKSGVLGDIQEVKLCRSFSFRRRADWQMRLDCGGGQLSVWGPHIIDQGMQFIGGPIKDVWGHLKRVNTPGDADDHVKIVMLGENGVLADLEISDAIAMKVPYCTIYGNRGSLISDEKTIEMRYIDPDYSLPDISASAGLPPTVGGYGNEEQFPWIEKTVDVKAEHDVASHVDIEMAKHLYDAIRKDVPFPIKNADALEVVRITNLVKKQNSQFDWLQ